MHNFDSAVGHLPGPFRDKEGRPLQSVRVALLPFLEEDDMYRQFHFDEPWDSPHNSQFLNRMPKVYQSVGNEPPHPSQTFYRLVMGPGTAFEKEPVTLVKLIAAEGTANMVF